MFWFKKKNIKPEIPSPKVDERYRVSLPKLWPYRFIGNLIVLFSIAAATFGIFVIKTNLVAQKLTSFSDYFLELTSNLGFTVDDILVYCEGNGKYFLVINAANIEKDVAWMQENAQGFNVKIDHQSDYYGQLAVQGPKAEALVEKLLGLECSELVFYTFKKIETEGETVIVSRTGYTGEDGFEIYGSHKFINEAWDKLIASGEVLPCGLGCRDTLRFEVGLPLYGDELSADISPIEAGLGMFVKVEKPEFIGKDAIVKQKTEGVQKKLVGIALADDDKAIPRHGYTVEADGQVIGEVTTGYRTIMTDKSVCDALVDAKYKELGTKVQVRIHKKLHEGTVVKKRFYDKSYKK